MGRQVLIIAAIDLDANRVTLSGTQPGLQVTSTFDVTAGDTLVWELRDASGKARLGPGALTARVRFVVRPGSNQKPLFKDRLAFESDPATMLISSDLVGTGAEDVPAGALPIEHRYHVELRRPDGSFNVLQCFWAPSPGALAHATEMAGGNESGGPAKPSR